MGIIVTKFGGSSLADAGQFRKVRDILLANPERRFVVPSAPGKRSKSDVKVTDMLYACHNAVVNLNGDTVLAVSQTKGRIQIDLILKMLLRDLLLKHIDDVIRTLQVTRASDANIDFHFASSSTTVSAASHAPIVKFLSI